VLERVLMSQKSESFQHLAHMGYDSQKGFSSVGVDPTWKALLEQLSMKGISAKDIQENEQFIKDFVEQSGGIEAVSFLISLQGRAES
jgi:Wiskott-Aldrich syndrome protein